MPIFGNLGRRHSRKPSKDKDRDKEKEKDAAAQQRDSLEKPSKPTPPKHQRTKTAPAEAPSLLRLPSTTSTVSAAQRSRRATNPTTPTALPTPHTTAAAPSSSYFSPQAAAASSTEPRSPATRRPPASFSAGHDTSRGPPVTLVTRGNSDYARRPAQKPADFAFAQQQFQQLGLVSPAGTHSTGRQGRHDSHDLGEATPRPQQTNRPSQPPRHKSTSAIPPAPQPMASSSEEEEESSSSASSSSDEESSPPSHFDDRRTALNAHGATDTSATDGEQTEDLFLNIAEDIAPKPRQTDAALRHDKLRSRVARINRMSSPSALQSPSPIASSSTTPTASRIPSSAEQRSSVQPRRASHLPTTSRTLQERPPQSPASPFETPRSRPPDLSTKASFSRRDSELSPRDFLAQFGSSKRRGSQPETLQTPPHRTGTYRPSNLGHYSSSRDDTRSPHIEAAPPETSSRADGADETESHGSTGPAVSVWDELDELKTRIRRIEMGGKIPATSSAIISQATAERPRTANTSATTVSSSPNQQRKTGPSPSESTVDAHTGNRIHPLLRDALMKARHHTSPAVYRILESTATEAMSLAEMTGSAGPQGTLHSASSILGGANISDRQVRRKADNICRSLTELCIAMCDTKSSLSSPSIRTSTATISRRPSVQINGDSPTVRQSIEPESNTLSNISPSRALHRIEARRTSMLVNGTGTLRDPSQEPFEYERQNPSRLQRAGTSLYRNRGNSVDEDEEDPTIRAPSRAMTDFRSIRGPEKSRLTARSYTSREPMPELQPAPALQSTASLRRPAGSSGHSLLFNRDDRRYDFQRESSPAIERQTAGTLRARQQLAASRNPNRNSIGGISDLGRSVSLGRGRLRGNSTGE